MSGERELLDDQVAYYRARAGEYDATFPTGDPFTPGGEATRAALRAFAPRGRVLEIAAGTGQWTSLLADYADELVVTDASPEMLDLNRVKVGERGIEYRVSDAFSLEPAADFDAVFFGFFLSHVPRASFTAFWDVVAGVMAPEGRVFFVDEAAHELWNEDWIDRDADAVRRTLADGTPHRAVKVLWSHAELESRLRALGWDASVHAADPFYWGTARR